MVVVTNMFGCAGEDREGTVEQGKKNRRRSEELGAKGGLKRNARMST
jgi:hypothetical protein